MSERVPEELYQFNSSPLQTEFGISLPDGRLFIPPECDGLVVRLHNQVDGQKVPLPPIAGAVLSPDRTILTIVPARANGTYGSPRSFNTDGVWVSLRPHTS